MTLEATTVLNCKKDLIIVPHTDGGFIFLSILELGCEKDP
jgi:hypothetical protein